MNTSSSRLKALWWVACSLCCMALVQMACAANAHNMALNGTPLYICPSSTPRPTDVMPPAAPPTYPASFQAGVDYYYVDPARSTVNVYYLAQNVGWVQISYSGLYQDGSAWVGSNGTIFLAYAAPNVPGITHLYPIDIPAGVVSAQIFISSVGGSQSFSITRYNTVLPSAPLPFPCCVMPPIYPTPQPTYTPYPTPTLFVMSQDYFLDDPVYNYIGPVQVRLRLHSPIRTDDTFFTLFTVASWTLDITNVGAEEYDFLGGLEMYVSEVNENGSAHVGVWSPSHIAATLLGIVEEAYYPQAIAPGQTITVRVAAIIPRLSRVNKISLVLDPPKAGDPGYATFTPGNGRVATWVNQTNTICEGEIKYP